MKQIFTIFLLAFSLSSSSEVKAPAKCWPYFAKLSELGAKEWGPENFTSPSEYNPNGPFQFIVHKLTKMDGEWSKRMIGSHDRIDLINNPKDISKVEVLSTSLVSDQRRVTYGGPVGLILKVPAQNIVATNPVDMQSVASLRKAFNESRDSLENLLIRYKEFFGVRDPRKLLEDTPRGIYNEVLVRGSSPGQEVEVIGIVLFENKGMVPLFPGVEEKVLESARKNNLPVIKISWDGKMDLSSYLKFEERNKEFQQSLKRSRP